MILSLWSQFISYIFCVLLLWISQSGIILVSFNCCLLCFFFDEIVCIYVYVFDSFCMLFIRYVWVVVISVVRLKGWDEWWGYWIVKEFIIWKLKLVMVKLRILLTKDCIGCWVHPQFRLLDQKFSEAEVEKVKLFLWPGKTKAWGLGGFSSTTPAKVVISVLHEFPNGFDFIYTRQRWRAEGLIGDMNGSYMQIVPWVFLIFCFPDFILIFPSWERSYTPKNITFVHSF